ncbi:MAG TPA: hypothetical protein VMV49_00495 [Candidatus Deferrimicrobium sp.]|nr:hypothetical protein [Candidatus Deferrimicrobium sp.]
MTEIFEVAYEVFLVREIFNSILIGALIVFGIYLLKKMREKEPGSAQRDIYLGYCLFLILYGLVRVFFVLSDIEVYNAHNPETFLNNIYVGIAYTCGIVGVLCLFYMIEKHLIHTRYIFTCVAVGIVIVSIISILSIIPTQIPQLIMLVSLPVFFGIVIFLYLYVAIKSPGEPRRRALGIMAGILVIMFGTLFNSQLIGGALESVGLPFEIRILIEPFIVIIGGAIFTFSQR